MLVLVPLLLGTGAIGINMIHAMQTIQVSRDAGHMYARGVDFAQTGNKVLLSKLGTNLGLASTNSGSAVVILSALTYVDKATCTAVGAVDEDGNPSGCTNYGKWVFTQRLVIGRSSLRSSNFGTPTGVTIDSLGRISMNDYVRRAGAVAQFSSANGINPYAVVDNQVSGLPSRQVLYLTEAAAQGFRMPPFVSGAPTYSFAFF
jgi:hypothetical protein